MVSFVPLSKPNNKLPPPPPPANKEQFELMSFQTESLRAVWFLPWQHLSCRGPCTPSPGCSGPFGTLCLAAVECSDLVHATNSDIYNPQEHFCLGHQRYLIIYLLHHLQSKSKFFRSSKESFLCLLHQEALTVHNLVIYNENYLITCKKKNKLLVNKFIQERGTRRL